MEEKAVTFIAEISGLIVVLGTFFAAIFQAKNSTEKVLLSRIEDQDKRIEKLEDEKKELYVEVSTLKSEREKSERLHQEEREASENRYSALEALHQSEKAARTRLERQVRELKKRLK